MFKRKFLTKAFAIALSTSLVLGNGSFEKFGTLHVLAEEQTEFIFSEESVTGHDAPSSVSDNDVSDVSDNDAQSSVSDSDAWDSASDNDARDEHEVHYGYIASEFDEYAPTIKEGASIEGAQNAVLPSYFGSVSATDYSIKLPSYMPPARDQNPYGTCWAHAAIGLAEINMAKKGYVNAQNVDYSELAIAYFGYNGTYKDPLGNFDGDEHSDNGFEVNFLDHGGNCSTAANLFSGWVGITAESKAPYSQAPQALENGLPDSLAFDDVAHLENYYVINRETNSEYVKQAIMEYGAVSMSYYANSAYYNEEYNCFYNYVNTSTNHANLAIGWNDNFPKEYFGTDNQPEGDGAWLLRNSWAYEGSEEESYYQYFWVSYYDTSLSEVCYVFDVEEAFNYDNNYQYDANLTCGSFQAVSGAQVANVFTAKACETGEALEAVGFHFWDANVGYTVQIYLNPTDESDPTSGTLQTDATVTGETTFAGYYTIPLKNSVYLNKGDKYAVVLTLTTDTDENIRIGIEIKSESDGWKAVPYAEAGQSFLKANPQYSWRDVGSIYGGNVEVKAFTKNLYENLDDFSFTDEKLETDGINIAVENSVEIGLQGITASAVSWSSEDESIATVKSGVVTGVAVGKTRISASFNGVERSFEVRVCDLQISGPGNAFAGETGDYSYKLEKGDADISEDEVTFSSSDESLATIDSAGRATFLRYGKVTFTVEVSGIKDSITVDISLKDPKVNCGAFSDGITKVWWDAVPGADYYVIMRKITDTTENVEIGRIRADGSATYHFEDDYFKEDVETWCNALYWVFAYIDSEDSWISYSSAYNYRSYSLNYVLNGGTLPADAPTYAKKGTTVTLPTPVREGYTFEGWYLEPDFSGTVLGETDTYITSDRTYYAKWSAGEVKVVFWPNGADTDGTGYVYYFKPGTEYDVPDLTAENFEKRFVKLGYELAGYSTTKDGQVLFTQGGKLNLNRIDGVNEDTQIIHLYAIWKPNVYTVTFDANGGEVSKGTLEVTYKEKYGALPKAWHDISTFDGWYDAVLGGNQITEDTIYAIAADTTLYAHWKVDMEDLSKYPEDYEELVEDAANRTGKTREEIEANIEKYIPNGLWTAGIKAYDYTGVAITQPTLHVYYKNKLLTLGTDYTVKYSNNVKASGKATVTITGKGNFTGSNVKYFTINPIDISGAFAEDIHVLFNARIQKAAPVVSFDLNGKTVKLKKGTDYSVEYGPGDFLSEGEYIIRIAGTGNYRGTKEIKEIIEPGNKVLMSKVTIAKIPDHYYTGEGIALSAQELKVTYQKMMLKEGVDYTVTYRKNKEVGTAQVTITGLDNEENTYAFVGSKTVTFKILGTSIAKAEVAPIPAQIYTANPIKPVLTVSLPGKTLKEGQDYTVAYSNNVNAGKAKVTITGINGYSGTLTKTFTITAKPLATGDIHMPEDLDDTQKYVYAYTKGGTCPEPAVICNGKTLIKNKDYTIKYSNHTASGKTAKITVTGKGNYAGKVELDYIIRTGKINELSVLVADIKATGKAGACNPVITITDVNGKKLSAGKDYYKSYVQSAKNTGAYTYAADYEVKQKDGSTLTRKAGDKVTDTDILHVGMVLNVTIYGNGEYAGSSTKASFRVTQNDISRATVKINKQQYTGKPINLTNTDSSAYNYISVTVGKEVLTDKDFEIVSYENNVEKGTAKVTIHGIGNYVGYKTVSFSITARNIRYQVWN